MAELAALPLAAVVVEERYSALTKVEQGLTYIPGTTSVRYI